MQNGVRLEAQKTMNSFLTMCGNATYSCPDGAQHSPTGLSCQADPRQCAFCSPQPAQLHVAVLYYTNTPFRYLKSGHDVRHFFTVQDLSHLPCGTSSILGLHLFYDSNTPQSLWQPKTHHKFTNCSCGNKSPHTPHSPDFIFEALILIPTMSILYSLNNPCLLLPQEPLQLTISLLRGILGLLSANFPSLPSDPCHNVTSSKGPALLTL